MKRMLALTLSCALLCGSLTGCAGSTAAQTAASSAVSAASSVSEAESSQVSAIQTDQSAASGVSSAAASSASGAASSAASAAQSAAASTSGTAGAGSEGAVLVAQVDSADAFDGCYEFQADTTGTYSFGSQYDGTYDYSKINYDLGAVTWQVFVLDKEFDDPPRLLGQAYTPALTDDGETQVKKGQYVYCICSMNAFSADQAVRGIATLDIYRQA